MCIMRVITVYLYVVGVHIYIYVVLYVCIYVHKCVHIYTFGVVTI